MIRQRIRDVGDPAAMREVDDRFLAAIIREGGSQFGRSNAMPAWSMRLSDEQIRTVVAYMRALSAGGASGPPGRKETP